MGKEFYFFFCTSNTRGVLVKHSQENTLQGNLRGGRNSDFFSLLLRIVNIN